MNPSTLAFALALVLTAPVLAACGDDAGGAAGTGGTGGGTTATEGSGGEGPACDESHFGVEGERADVTLRIENRRDVPIYIHDDCYAEGVDGVHVDGQSLDSWNAYSCASAIAGQCGSFSMDCFGNGDVVVEPGASVEVIWDGLIRSERLEIPASCGLDDCDTGVGGPILHCRQLLTPTPGEHTASVSYSLEEGPGDVFEATATFDFPTDAVTIVVAAEE